MTENPVKIFPCQCMSKGLITTVDEDQIQADCVGAPYINISFWKFGIKFDKDVLTLWERIKYAIHILKGKCLWTDMVTFDAKVAKNFAYHILYLINKSKKKFDNNGIVWPENESVNETEK